MDEEGPVISAQEDEEITEEADDRLPGRKRARGGTESSCKKVKKPAGRIPARGVDAALKAFEASFGPSAAPRKLTWVGLACAKRRRAPARYWSETGQFNHSVAHNHEEQVRGNRLTRID